MSIDDFVERHIRQYAKMHNEATTPALKGICDEYCACMLADFVKYNPQRQEYYKKLYESLKEEVKP